MPVKCQDLPRTFQQHKIIQKLLSTEWFIPNPRYWSNFQSHKSPENMATCMGLVTDWPVTHDNYKRPSNMWLFMALIMLRDHNAELGKFAKDDIFAIKTLQNKENWTIRKALLVLLTTASQQSRDNIRERGSNPLGHRHKDMVQRTHGPTNTWSNEHMELIATGWLASCVNQRLPDIKRTPCLFTSLINQN